MPLCRGPRARSERLKRGWACEQLSFGLRCVSNVYPSSTFRPLKGPIHARVVVAVAASAHTGGDACAIEVPLVLRAVVASREHEDHRVVALLRGERALLPGAIGLVVGESGA